tara:strand:- start:11152 stop:11277 length:126 start_codon:yes stop_codon:yes gene_type:complete
MYTKPKMKNRDVPRAVPLFTLGKRSEVSNVNAPEIISIPDR